MKRIIGSTLAILFLIGLNSYKASAGRIPPVPIITTEQDGDPLSITRRLVFPNGSVINTGGGVLEINFAGSGDIAELTASTVALQIQLDANDALTGDLGISTATNASGIAGNLTIIGLLSGATFTNSVNIATNVSDIAGNTAVIGLLGASTDTFQTQIDANSDLLGIMGTSTDTLQGLIDTNIADILDLGTSTGTIDASLTAHINATSVHGATASNLADRIVLRDISGNFSAGTITASLTGASSLNVLKTGDTMTGNFNVNGASTALVGTASNIVLGVTNPSININNNGFAAGLVVQTTLSGLQISIRNKSGAINGIGGTSLAQQIAAFGGNALELYHAQDRPLVFGSNNAEVARITSTGFGIGVDPTEALDVLGNALISGSYMIDGEVAFSSVPVHHAGGFNSTLGAGTTFYAFVPDSAVRLTRITATVVVSGIGGTGDQFFCSDGTNALSVTVAAAAVAGTVTSSQGSALVAAGDTVNYRMESDAGTTPTVNVDCQYAIQ